MRRPAQFSGSGTTPFLPMIAAATVTTIPLDAPVSEKTPASRPWQEDGKFAVALLGVVILINLAVILWLSAIAPTPVTPRLVTKQTEQTGEANVHELGENASAASSADQ